MVTYGVVQDYPSVFTSFGDEDVLRFLNSTGGTGIEINVENIENIDQNNDIGIIVVFVFIFVLLGLFLVIGFLCVRRYWPFSSLSKTQYPYLYLR